MLRRRGWILEVTGTAAVNIGNLRTAGPPADPPGVAALMIFGIDEALIHPRARAQCPANAGRVVGSALAMAVSLDVLATAIADLLQQLYSPTERFAVCVRR